MTERTHVYDVEPSEPEESAEKGASLLASGVSGAGSGVTGWFFGNPEAGVEWGLGIGGFSLGLLFSMDSGRRALYDARNGRIVKALLRAVESTLEGALSLAVPAAAMGLHAGGIEEATKMAVLGGLSGGALALVLLRPSLSQAFRERNQTPSNPAIAT